MIVECLDTDAMVVLGARIAEQVRPGDVIALKGTLGAGKTTLARAIIANLGHEGEVPSPTFTIIETYEDTRIPVVHADFYRLENPDEAQEIGLDDYRDGAALIAEWPDKAGGFKHETNCLAITIEIVGQGRRAIVDGGQGWLGRMP